MATVVITIGGIDRTAILLLDQCFFTSQVNGMPGDALVRVRDADSSLTFTVGEIVILTIDGDVVWRGFVMQPVRSYAFAAIGTAPMRIWTLRLVDINILFQRRAVFNQADPDNVYGTLFPPNTDDSDAIADLVANFLDLTGDNIDTATLVETVGVLDPAQPSRPWSGGFTWGEAMTSIAMVPAAIYYLSPTATGADLVYTDVDTPNAPFELSDVPSGGGGVSTTLTDEFDRIVPDGDNWGTGPFGLWDGTSSTVFSVDGSAGFATDSGTYTGRVVTPAAYDVFTHGTLSAKFRWPTGGFGSYDEFAIEITNGGATARLFGGAVVWEDPDFYVYGFSNSFFGDFPLSGSPALGEWGNLKVDVTEPNQGRMKFWKEGDPEPDWQVVGTTGAGSFSAPKTIRAFFSNDNPETWEIDDVTLAAESGGGGPTVNGYREMEVLFDGANLANDVMCWGIGYGLNEPVFVRLVASPAVHGLWQFAKRVDGVYEQATIDRIADSILNGSPTNRRGQKDDRIAVIVKTYSPGLLPAQKVVFESQVFDYSVTLPIRKMEITFPAPETPLYALTLSLDIDAPWGFIDGLMFNLPRIVFPPFPPFPQPPRPSTCACGLTDTFDRVEASGWGVSDAGITWSMGGATSEVDGARGSVESTGFLANGTLIFPVGAATALTVVCEMDGVSADPDDIIEVDFSASSVAGAPTLVWNFARSGAITLATFTPPGDVTGSAAFVPTQAHNLRLLVEGTTGYARLWLVGDPEPATWDLTLTGLDAGMETAMDTVALGVDAAGASPLTGFFNDLNVPGVEDCADAPVVDDFARTVSSGWGTASSGPTWAKTAVSGTSTEDVTSGQGNSTTVSGDVITDMILPLSDSLLAAFSVGTAVELRWLVSTELPGVGGFYNPDSSRGLDWFIATDGSLSYGRPGVHQLVLFTPPLDGSPFWVVVHGDFLNSIIQAKAWLASDTEPDWDPTSLSIGTLTPNELTRCIVRAAGQLTHTGTLSIGHIEARIRGFSCSPMDSLLPTNPQGRLCETPIRLSSTEYQTSVPFVPGSTEVYVDGLRQRLGASREYIEDAGSQSLTFDDPQSSSAAIWVCYFVAATVP